MFAIICDARAGQDKGIEVLALVDRKKSKNIWWTSDDASIILGYVKESAAISACNNINFNSPRVVPLKVAVQFIKEQESEIMNNAALDDAEAGWDGHKNVF